MFITLFNQITGSISKLGASLSSLEHTLSYFRHLCLISGLQEFWETQKFAYYFVPALLNPKKVFF